MGAVGADIVEEISEMRAGFSLDSPTKVAHLAVGSAFNSNTGGESAGHVRIYKYDSGWTELGYGINGSNAYDYLGSSLALANDDADGAEDGLIVAVGAPGASGNRGLVAVYEFDGTEWQQNGCDLFGDNDGDQFGFSVSLSKNGTRLTVGAKHAAGNNTGSVRVYDWKTDPTWSDYPTEKWVAVSLDILAEAAGDAAGFAVSMAGDGSRVAIGAPESDANGTDSGQVRVYELERWDAIAPWPPPWQPHPFAAAISVPHRHRLRRHLHHHRLSRQRGIKWVPISMARLLVTIMAGRSLCLAMVCAWRLELRSMTTAVQDTRTWTRSSVSMVIVLLEAAWC